MTARGWSSARPMFSSSRDRRRVWDEPDPQLLTDGQDLLLGTTPPQRVLALHRGDRQADVLHLPVLDQIRYRSGDVLDRHTGVDPVLVYRSSESTPRWRAGSLGRDLVSSPPVGGLGGVGGFEPADLLVGEGDIHRGDGVGEVVGFGGSNNGRGHDGFR
jgi:hypothetical protein